MATENGERQLTAGLLRKETANGSYWNELYGMLGRLSSRGLSDELVLNLKKWSHYYGDARQAQLIVIAFRSEAARDELCADPALEPYLTPFAGSQPLAVISAEHVRHVFSTITARRTDTRRTDASSLWRQA